MCEPQSSLARSAETGRREECSARLPEYRSGVSECATEGCAISTATCVVMDADRVGLNGTRMTIQRGDWLSTNDRDHTLRNDYGIFKHRSRNAW